MQSEWEEVDPSSAGRPRRRFYRLTEAGHVCDVYERWPGLGGQAATLDVGGGVLLERYYHHLFTSDRDIAALAQEREVTIDWHPSSVAFFADGESHPFTTPLDLLRFSPMTPLSRVRLGLAVLNLQHRHPDVAPFEGITAKEWILRLVGPSGWDSMNDWTIARFSSPAASSSASPSRGPS